MITEPTGDADVDAGELTIRGVAWSGAAPIAGVEVSVGDGPWQPAQLIGERRRHSWQWWELLTRLDEPARRRCAPVRPISPVVRNRSSPHWNRLGYGGNAIQTISIHVR